MPPLPRRRNLGYEDVLASLAEQGISIRVASPKLVMEEVGDEGRGGVGGEGRGGRGGSLYVSLYAHVWSFINWFS